MSVTFNSEIAQRIMGSEVFESHYRDPKQKDGALGKLPEFFVVANDQELLRQTMRSHGYELKVTENPPDNTTGMGKTFTACFERQNRSFEMTHGYEYQAVCFAALKAYGFLIDVDAQ